MEKERILEELRGCIVNLSIQRIGRTCQDALEVGISPMGIIKEISKGMEVVGKKYETGEYVVPELVVAGETMKEALKTLEPHLKGAEIKKIGKVVLGTVEGELHDLGKNIVATLLTGAGFEVIDLGIDVSAENFLDEVRTHNPDILGLSAFSTTTMSEIEDVIKALEKAGIRDKTKIIIGGASITEEYARKVGADAYAPDAVKGLALCKKWMEGVFSGIP